MSCDPAARAEGSRSIETVVTYLEMTASPARPPRYPPRPDLEIRRAWRPTVSFYRYLYAAVGEPWTWTVRRWLSDAELAAILSDPRVEVNVLWAGGVPAGYAELDRRAPPDIEVGYFGLMPEFIAQGLGAYLLDWAIHHAWRSRPRRLWLHTCDLDHPRALSFYQRLGFRIYDRRDSIQELPPGWPHPRARSEPQRDASHDRDEQALCGDDSTRASAGCPELKPDPVRFRSISQRRSPGPSRRKRARRPRAGAP